jgi:hypothetical protein
MILGNAHLKVMAKEANLIPRKLFLLICGALLATPAQADDVSCGACAFADCCPETQVAMGVEQDPADQMQGMPGMQHGAGHGAHAHHPTTFVEEILHHGTAGTSAEPASTPHEMLMAEKGSWMLMFHGGGSLVAQQQTGARGGDKVFGVSWFMPMAQRELGPGTFTARVMISLDPATITDRRYPELFQLGETAFGKPIVDGQHPHDFFMEVAALYDLKLGKNALLSFYAAPVGDPAMGPEAYAHRESASEDVLAPLGHHQEDSTHISNDVLTVGLTYKKVRVEASAFHGREPDEFRWNMDYGGIDSWSARLTINPARNWSGQYSLTRLKSPEQLIPAESTLRMTASVTYNRPLARGNWASTVVWGRNRDIPSGQVLNSYLAESTLRFAKSNFAWTRIENVDRTNELLLGNNPLPPGFDEKFLARVQAYSFGYDREFRFIPHVVSALGGQYTLYAKPSSLDALYGSNPMGYLFFVRFRAVPSE